MTDGGIPVAYVRMPERGVFLVALPDGFSAPGGTQCLVRLDYGEDVGTFGRPLVFDPETHGARLPGFRLLRTLAAEDAERIAANAELADSICVTFLKLCAAGGNVLRIVSKRLSFGRDRLFVRYASAERTRPDLSRPCAEIKRLFGVSVNAWSAGPRDEVSLGGAMGPCGRECCCSSWMQKYPQQPAGRQHGSAAAQNGICGRYRCCLSFEQDTSAAAPPQRDGKGD